MNAALCVVAGGGALITALPAAGPVSAAALAVGAAAVLLSLRLPLLGTVAVVAILVALLTGAGTVGEFAIAAVASAVYLLACHGGPWDGRAGVVIGALLATGAAVLALSLPLGPRWLGALAPLIVTGLYVTTFWDCRSPMRGSNSDGGLRRGAVGVGRPAR